MHTNAAKIASEQMISLQKEIRSIIQKSSTQGKSVASIQSSPGLKADYRPQKVEEGIKSIQLLTNVVPTHKSRFLPRKPRSLLFSKQLDDWMMTSTLDGSLQTWSLGRKAIEGTSLHLPSLFNETCYAEDLCMNQRGSQIAIVLGEPSTAAAGNTEGSGPILIPASSGFTTKLALMNLEGSGKSQFGKPFIVKTDYNPHTKSISSIASYYGGPSDRNFYYTGGNDRSLVFWDIDEEGKEVKCNEVHRRHTSSIHSICQQYYSRTVWTGGADMRLVGFASCKSQIVHEQKLDYRISHIMANNHHPHTLLLSQSRQQQQMRFIDVRIPNSTTIQPFGWTELTNTSRYLKPSWHHAGNLISCGMSNPAIKYSGINVWDMRWVEKSGDPLQVIEMQAEKRYWCSEFHPTKDVLVAMATDCSVSFLDYKLA